ncbi:flagellar protein FliS [Desulfomarina profundi]|uniref:Flagellar secretion chaperone FliS n=1 Tax=Desulfomarina profundi TaxID=2772557 RepID=A0A8D5FFU6_9BACT|nr:flagellar export chaperone FliS [Desulfomarina profundi]BCL60553.1 flagellar protein FliS [Desulfomarina profundi]
MNAYMNQYQQNQVMTASREQILIMLYDGAIRFCHQAIAASRAGNMEEKIGRIAKIFAIITEFSNSLDHNIGGEIAADLDGLYQFMLRELHKARKDPGEEHLKIVEGLLVDLRQTWSEAIEITKNEQNSIGLEKQDKTNEMQHQVNHLSAAG